MFQAWVKTSLGPLLCSFEGDCLVGLHFGLGGQAPPRQARPHALAAVVEQLESYLAGRRRDLRVRFSLPQGTPFQRRVWQTTRTIPYGETRSYAWVAERMGCPRAARAVGQALGRNPLPLLIPCHRVVASNGSLGGFTGGLEIKRKLLGLEGALPRAAALSGSPRGAEE